MAIIADFMLVFLPAPTVPLGSLVSKQSGLLRNLFRGCPDNAFQVRRDSMSWICVYTYLIRTYKWAKPFQVALTGTSYTLLQRFGAIVVKNSFSSYYAQVFFTTGLLTSIFWWILQRNGGKLFCVATSASIVSKKTFNWLRNSSNFLLKLKEKNHDA